ncbi:Hsp70 family protein [Breoghania sp. L-A4]|uniref:Hsp70 family protein n=1 Tax=Breoghania sp. L-A4 TaxID=2304600 RepID=UPI000E35AFF7|nr:Hsp70 family protein [Breoghania sp. L-A4]AXS40032.1 Hsp70 family protein [Breoghania sp. L-A4]
MTHLACGLDFGTSNSTLAIHAENAPRLLPLEGDEVTIPSAVFFGTEPQDAFLVGRAAMRAYVEGATGRLMRSLKSILGSSLIEDRTQVYKRRIAFSEVIRLYIAELKARAEIAAGAPIDHVVLGRPVHFVDNKDEADAQAEATLLRIAREIGFSDVSFQFEPVAAAFDYERRIDRERIVLIADFGGGTSDFTVVRLSPDRNVADDRARDILANGGLRLGGTDYDRTLSISAFMPTLGHETLQTRGDLEIPAGPYWDLSNWADIHHLYDPKRLIEIRHTRQVAQRPEFIDRLIHIIEERKGHSMLIEVEAAKIALSSAPAYQAALDWIEAGLTVTATRDSFERTTARLRERLRGASLACVAESGLTPEAISAIFFTGGTSQIPNVREAITHTFPDAQVIDGDRFGSVGLGLAIEAKRRYG